MWGYGNANVNTKAKPSQQQRRRLQRNRTSLHRSKEFRVNQWIVIDEAAALTFLLRSLLIFYCAG